jgi:hypothetical protein
MNWVNVAASWRAGVTGGDCSDLEQRHREMLTPTGRVEITYDLQEPKVDAAKCKAARAALKARNRQVGKLLGQLRRAETRSARARLSRQLTTARKNRAKAVQRVAKVCTG